MINQLHSLLHRPERGWDPVPVAHARDYARRAWDRLDTALVQAIEDRLGGMAGKRVLDLGGGPGQYAVTLARRGARVTWHDVSRTYLDIARERAAAAGVTIRFSIGYLEDAAKFRDDPFDFVFCRECWYYCKSDREFAGIVYRLVRPGGAGYVDSLTRPATSAARRAQQWLNDRLWLKLGHPYPPPGRMAALMRAQGAACVDTTLSVPTLDRVYFTKDAGGGG